MMFNFVCVETALNMQRMKIFEKSFNGETTIKHAIVRTTLEQHLVAYTPCWSYVDPMNALILYNFVKRITVRGYITVFRGTFKFYNFYCNYHIEANQVNFSPFSRFKLRTPGVHRSVPPNVHLGTMSHDNNHEMTKIASWVSQD